jgi:class 3 adenylate cyclase
MSERIEPGPLLSVGDLLERRLVAVMFTDMVGYTSLLQADERTALESRER